MSNIQKMVGILGFVVVLGMEIENASADCPAFPTGFTCKCNGDDSMRVCATWSQGSDPILNTDFAVDYLCTGCSDAPEVKFATADDGWELYSEELDGNGDPDGPADLGDVLLADDVSPDSGDFKVRIWKSGAFGALNVSSIVLDSSDGDWTGGSTLATTAIFGSVNGAITLIKGSANKGDISGTVFIWGDVAGAITVAKVSGSVTISGDVEGMLTIPSLTGTFDIGGELAQGEIGTISAGALLEIGGIFGSGAHELDITGELAGILRITGPLNNHGVTIDIADFEGTGKLEVLGSPIYPAINLYNGIDSADARVDINYHGGQIYLHDKDVLGVLDFIAFLDGAGLRDGGVLKGSVRCGSHPTTGQKVNKGTIEFASVAAGGEIVADVQVAFQGTIDISGDMAGLIKIENDLSPSPGGKILIDGDLTGWVECNADVEDGAEITIGGALTGTAKITVDGVCDGDISVGKNTTSNTLIHCKGGLGATGSIVINSGEGNYNAAGSITVGSGAFAPIVSDYDGCIHIQDEAGTGNGGDLDGQIRIAVCDDEIWSDPEFDHNVCVDGDVNGTIDVVNSSCANQPGYDCYGACAP